MQSLTLRTMLSTDASIDGARLFNATTTVAAGAVAAGLGPTIGSDTAAALVAVSGLMSAFFLALSVQILDRASNWRDRAPVPSAVTSEEADRIENMAANSAYGTLVSFPTTVAGVAVVAAQRGWQHRVFVAVLAALLVHVGITLLRCGLSTSPPDTLQQRDRAPRDVATSATRTGPRPRPGFELHRPSHASA